MIEVALSLSLLAGTAVVLVLLRVWRVRSARYKFTQCHKGRHQWSPEPIRGAGGLSLTTQCKNCGAAYTRHRGF